MANLMYGACVRMALGYCSIEWSESKTNSFLVSGNLEIINNTGTGKKIFKFHLFSI